MATFNNSGLGFFAAMVPVSPEDAHRTVVKPVEVMKSQTAKAAQIRQDPANLKAVAELEKCATALAAALYGPAAIATSGATAAKQDEAHQDVVSTPSFRS